jgi:hypothetical protein
MQYSRYLNSHRCVVNNLRKNRDLILVKVVLHYQDNGNILVLARDTLEKQSRKCTVIQFGRIVVSSIR